MDYYIQILFAGLVGGTLRGLVGYVKYQTRFKSVPFKYKYFISMVSLSAIIGLLAAWAARDIGIKFIGLPSITPAIAFIIGYAGGDFIENVFKIITKKDPFFSFENLKNI